jgi:hypothetical protein
VTYTEAHLQGSSDTLYQFLQNQSQHATHFMIGSNILGNQAQFKYAFETLQDDIAVHTYSHPMMTTLSNAQVVAELGYTVQIIRDLTGGLLPRFWRPPYGDSDVRVRAIAMEVFGLVTVIGNQDAAGGFFTPGAMTAGAAGESLQERLHGPKSPGLNVLHHEVRQLTRSVCARPDPDIRLSYRTSLCRRSWATTRSPYSRAGRSCPYLRSSWAWTHSPATAWSVGSPAALCPPKLLPTLAPLAVSRATRPHQRHLFLGQRLRQSHPPFQ